MISFIRLPRFSRATLKSWEEPGCDQLHMYSGTAQGGRSLDVTSYSGTAQGGRSLDETSYSGTAQGAQQDTGMSSLSLFSEDHHYHEAVQY